MMKRIIFFLVVATLVIGCGVSRKKVNNWNPNNPDRSSAFYECLQQAQQGEYRAAFGANQYGAGGGAHAGAKTNIELLTACMNAKGYECRKMRGGEVAFTLITIPLAIPFAILGADVANFY